MPEAPTVYVHYARANSFTPRAVAGGRDLLDHQEIAHAERFHFERDRNVYIGAHALLRRALSRHAAVDPGAWRFEPEEHGRPRIVSPPTSLRFSLAHTRTLAACAIAADLDLGFDVEDTTGAAPLEVADRWFTPAELADLASLAPAAQSDRFFVYWTLKEAYMKATGLGLSLPLDSFSFKVSDSNIEVSFSAGCPDDPAEWIFRSWVIEPGSRAALAVRATAIAGVDVSCDESAR